MQWYQMGDQRGTGLTVEQMRDDEKYASSRLLFIPCPLIPTMSPGVRWAESSSPRLCRDVIISNSPALLPGDAGR